MTARWRSLAIIVCAVTLASAAGLRAQTQAPKTIKREPAQATKTLEGKDSFDSYCAVCHGKDAKGGGPAASALKMPPADLTLISQKNGGKFPTVHVRDVILGTAAEAPAHGDRDMPIWGDIFRNLSGNDRDIVLLRTTNLVQYLEGLQVK